MLSLIPTSLLVLILLFNISISYSKGDINNIDNIVSSNNKNDFNIFNTLVDIGTKSNKNEVLKRYKITTVDDYVNIDKELDDICNLCVNVFFNDNNENKNNFFFKTITLNILKRLQL